MRGRGPFDAIFSLGDAIDAYDEPDEDQIEFRWQLLEAQLESAFPRVPRYWVVGNHELGRRSVVGEFSGRRSLERRQGVPTGGHLYFSRQVGPLRWVALDAETATGGKRLDPTQVAWLAGELQATAGPVVLLSHTPLLGTEGFAADAPTTLHFASGSRFRLSKQERADFFTIANAADAMGRLSPRVVLVVSGHLHSYNRVIRGGQTAVSLTTTSQSLALSMHSPGDSEFVRAYPNRAGDLFPDAIARRGFATLELSQRQLRFAAYTGEGTELDHFIQELGPMQCGTASRGD